MKYSASTLGVVAQRNHYYGGISIEERCKMWKSHVNSFPQRCFCSLENASKNACFWRSIKNILMISSTKRNASLDLREVSAEYHSCCDQGQLSSSRPDFPCWYSKHLRNCWQPFLLGRYLPDLMGTWKRRTLNSRFFQPVVSIPHASLGAKCSSSALLLSLTGRMWYCTWPLSWLPPPFASASSWNCSTNPH